MPIEECSMIFAPFWCLLGIQNQKCKACNQAKFMKMKFVFGHPYSSFFEFSSQNISKFSCLFPCMNLLGGLFLIRRQSNKYPTGIN